MNMFKSFLLVWNTGFCTNVTDRGIEDDLYHVKFTSPPPSYRHSLKSEVERSAPDTDCRTLRLATWETWPWRGKLGTTCGNKHFKAATNFSWSDPGTFLAIMTWPDDPETVVLSHGDIIQATCTSVASGKSHSQDKESLYDLLIARQFLRDNCLLLSLSPALPPGHWASTLPPSDRQLSVVWSPLSPGLLLVTAGQSQPLIGWWEFVKIGEAAFNLVSV